MTSESQLFHQEVSCEYDIIQTSVLYLYQICVVSFRVKDTENERQM